MARFEVVRFMVFLRLPGVPCNSVCIKVNHKILVWHGHKQLDIDVCPIHETSDFDVHGWKDLRL